MVKKVVDKIPTKSSKKTSTKKIHKSPSSSAKKMTAKEREELLIENFVGLQHAMTNLSIKFGSLSDNISKLLQVFEESAKSFIQGDKGDDKDMLNKIDSLLDQNKTIAKGLVLMEGKLRGRNDTEPRPEMPPQKPRPLPKI